MKSTLIALFVTLLSSKALADQSVKCSTVAKVPKQVLEYTISSESSKRLLSGLIYKDSNNIDRLIFPQDVAQYKTSQIELFVLGDANGTTPALQMVALGLNGKEYIGAISEFNNSGKVTKNIAVKCKISAAQ